MTLPFYILFQQCTSISAFLHPHQHLLVWLFFKLFWKASSDFHCAFNLHSVMANNVLICHLCFFLNEMVAHVFCPFSSGIVWFFTIWFWEISVNSIFMNWKYFLLICSLSFHIFQIGFYIKFFILKLFWMCVKFSNAFSTSIYLVICFSFSSLII